ncbi:MAG: hypothetical protein ACOCZK_07410 [Planctomycetota bacterium]
MSQAERAAAGTQPAADQDPEGHRRLTFRQATIYDRALSEEEVARNHAAGPEPALDWRTD